MSRYRQARPDGLVLDLDGTPSKGTPAPADCGTWPPDPFPCAGKGMLPGDLEERARQIDNAEEEQSYELRRPYLPPVRGRSAVPADAQLTSWDLPVQPERPKFLRVALVGAPNAGKSSLLNALMASPISAVSPKVNTTRSDIRGVMTRGDSQIVFIDAPGILPSHQKAFSRELVGTAWKAYEDADLVLLIVDSVKKLDASLLNLVRRLAPRRALVETVALRSARQPQESDGDEEGVKLESAIESQHRSLPALGGWASAALPAAVADLRDALSRQAHGSSSSSSSSAEGKRPPVALLLNKADKVTRPRYILTRKRELNQHGTFDGVFFVSAKFKRGLPILEKYLMNKCKEAPWKYPAELKTTLSKTQTVEQLIKHHLFKWFNKELPYQITQQTIGWTERLDGTLVIEQELQVKNDVVARIVSGVRARILLQLRKHVSQRLQEMWNRPVVLSIVVKPLQRSQKRK